jgi:hypothetical protein
LNSRDIKLFSIESFPCSSQTDKHRAVTNGVCSVAAGSKVLSKVFPHPALRTTAIVSGAGCGALRATQPKK